MIKTLLGDISPRRFLEEYWQKKPLLVRNAVPGFCGLLERDALFDLACDPDVESRLVRNTDGQWSVASGPQKRSALKGRKHPWTVLVQGVNLHLPEGDKLLHEFDFIPQARLDDLMVSYAVDGGGVGPHFDNYDVFLLQGTGQRRWQIGDQSDRELVPDAPLKRLANFQPTFDWVLDPGDLLYLPPHWAHNGTAIGECTTYSIGFRSPTAQELGMEFLGWFQERLELDGIYVDPDLEPQQNSAEISAAMIDQVEAMISRIRWRREDISDFLGHYLTEPKSHVFFDQPDHILSRARFRKEIEQRGFRLDTRSILLMASGIFYLNGERLPVDEAEQGVVAELAHLRRLGPINRPTAALIDLLHQLHIDGFGHPGERS